MISFSQVFKRYPGGREALKNLSFAIEPGEMVFLSGPSGAGKSTLLRLIAAIELPSDGNIIVCGQNLSRLRHGAVPFLRRHLGLIFQDQKLLFERTVLENMLLPLQIRGLGRAESMKRAHAALDKVGLSDRGKTYPVALSGGEQQRLCIARAVVSRPAIILADEPTANLDREAADAIMAMFNSFHQAGTTIIISTHEKHLTERFDSRMLNLAAGELEP